MARGEWTLNHTDACRDDLQKLLLLGVSRERLVETFGFSGLPRLEKMLAERRPKLIEGDVADG